MAQLDRRICRRLDFAEKSRALLQRLPRCLELAVIVLKDRDLVAFKTDRSETNATKLCIFVAVASTKIVGGAEIDHRCHTIEFDPADKTSATGQRVAQIAATVFPLVIDKRHSFLAVGK